MFNKSLLTKTKLMKKLYLPITVIICTAFITVSANELNTNNELFNKTDVVSVTTKSSMQPTAYGNYFSLGTGFGRSYGGFGFRAQFRRGDSFAFGPHLGMGYTPNTIGFPLFMNIGMKIFFFNPIYLDLQFGVFGENSAWITSTIYDEWPAWGPTLMTGADINIGKMFGINFAGGISLDMGGMDIFFPAFDIGFFIRFQKD